MYQMIHFSKMEVKEITSFLKSTFMFRGVSEKTLNEAIGKIDLISKSFEKNECIYSPSSYSDMIGFVKNGICEVRRVHPDGTSVPLNIIEKYGTFGIVAVFGNKQNFPTYVYAKKACSIVFISKKDFIFLFNSYNEIALNTAKFLTERITFLNEKVTTFSGNTVTEKLAHYILSLSEANKRLDFEFNRKKSAEIINTGRASLYRALTELKNEGIIDYDSKKIYINDLIGLERKTK